MSKKPFAIDIDGVLRDFVGSLLVQYAKDFPYHEVDHINEWDLHKFFPIGKSIYDYAFNVKAKEIFENAPMFPGAREFIDDLRVRGHHVCLLTQQPRGKEIHTLNWLYESGIPYDSIAFSAEKGLFDFELILDDAEHNLRAVRAAGKRAICFDRPYNQNWDGERVKTYQEFLELVDANHSS